MAQDYDLGHAAAELERLKVQAAVMAPITRRLFEEAGIGPGMRVLDIGSGAGDVAILLADLVGPTGEVVGSDRAPEAVKVARARIEALGLGNVTFREGDPGEMAFDQTVRRLRWPLHPDVPCRSGSDAARLAHHVGPVASWHSTRSTGTAQVRSHPCQPSTGAVRGYPRLGDGSAPIRAWA